MPDSLYPETATAPGAPPADNASDTDSASEPDTALVPKTLLGDGVKVGDTVSMKVVHIYEDEVELGNAEETAEKEPTEYASQTPDQQLEGMAMQNGGGMGGE